MNEDITRLHRRIAELGEQSQRYRTAWMSARNRARSYATDLEAHMDWSDDMQDERNALRAEVVQLGSNLDAKRWTVRRLAESVHLAQAELESWRTAFGDDALDVRTAKLRAALEEERIEPDPAPSGLCQVGRDGVSCVISDLTHRDVYHGGQPPRLR